MSEKAEPRWPAYRIIAGNIHRQAVRGGRWEQLSARQANDLLRQHCDGLEIPEPPSPS